MPASKSKKPAPSSLPTPPASPPPPAPPDAAAAFAAIKPEILALAPGELAFINMDIPHAVSMVLGVIPGLAALRPAIAHGLPSHPIALFDKLETYALAAWYAHLIAQSGGAVTGPVKPLLDEGAALRATLLGDAEALAARGLLDPDTVAEIRSGHGNVDTANDLLALSALFTSRWSAIQGKTAATAAEVARAGTLGPMLLAALGVREHADEAPDEAADHRARAFTLFTRAYDATRRAVAYLRWNEGDADSLAPSLYKGRGGRGSGHASDDKSAPGGATAGGSLVTPAGLHALGDGASPDSIAIAG